MLLGRPKGYWAESGCSGGQSCTIEISSSITAGTIKQEEWSKELTQSISATITAGLEVEAAGVTGSVETSYTSSTTGMIGSAQTLINSNDLTTGQKCTVPTDMTNFDIYKIWQWTVSTPVGTNDVVAKTCDITCTPDGNAPKFLPGWPESIKACKWKTGETRDKFEPVILHRKTPPPTQRNPKDACVRFFSGENGGGRMSKQCTDLSNSISYTFHQLPDQLINQVRSYKCGKNISYFNAVKKSGDIQRIYCGSRDQSHKIPSTTIDSRTVSIHRS